MKPLLRITFLGNLQMCSARLGPSRGDPRLRHSDKAGLSTPGPGLGRHPSHPRSRHAAVHGSARPAVTLGFATPIRPGSLHPDPDSDGIRVTQGNVASDRTWPGWPSTAPTRTRTTLPNPNRCLCHRGYANCGRAEAPLWQVRGTCWRSNHVNLTRLLRSSSSPAWLTEQSECRGLTVWERAPFTHRTNAVCM